MAVDDETRRTLNLLRDEPRRAVRVAHKLKTIRIETPDAIDAGQGVYWLAGRAALDTGTLLDCVFVLDTGTPQSPADPASVRTWYLWARDGWYEHSDPGGLARLEVHVDEAYPLVWRTHVPLRVAVTRGPDQWHDPTGSFE
ncbi:MAG: hypothetical protein AAGJ70_05805 [Pseudomonadota bacterium]